MSEENNICAVCGGVKRFRYKVELLTAEQVAAQAAVGPTLSNPTPVSWKLCHGHSESAPKYDEAPLRLQEQVFLAIGRASMCWDRTPPGVFDDLKAKAIGEQLIQDIARELNRQQLAEPAQKHDGDLDKDYQVEYASEWDIRGVRIHATDPSIQGQEVFLVPHRALSLLDWLRQEEAELQRLAKEQGF